MKRTTLAFALVLTIAAPLAIAAPTALSPERADPTRYTVGFWSLPRGIAEGDEYNGGRVVLVDEPLQFIAILTTAPALFEARTALDENVRYVELSPWMPLIHFTPNDPRYGSMYGPQQIGAPAAWDQTLGSTSAILCVTDTGVRYTHEDLTGTRWGGGRDVINNDNDPLDDNGHGTHVTGTAAASTNNGRGVAGIAQATFKHAKVLNGGGSGTLDQVATGIRWCADNGAHVISASLGASTGATALQDAVNYAWNAGSVFVAAAGNSGPCSNCVGYPAKYTNSVAVSCTTSSKSLCSFSSTGPEVDLAAPGNGIDSTWHTSNTAYSSISGTSMSTPHVSGAAALVKSKNPTWSNSQIRSALENNAEDLGAAGTDASFGKGLVRVDRALGTAPPPPAACGDGIDNDGDGLVDYPNDPGCSSSTDTDESNAAPPPGESRVYFENMDDGAQGWTKSTSTDLWHTTGACITPIGTRHLAWTQDSTCTYSTGSRVTNWAQSGAVSLSGKTQATLKLKHQFQIEQYAGGAYDILRVQVSRDAFSWTTLQQWDSRNADVLSWTSLSYDIDGFTGGNLYVRFWTDTVDGLDNAHRGWFIEDVEVTAG